MPEKPPAAAVKAFHGQRRSAKRRGIPFLFGLTDWWAWWQIDGRWERRGRTRDALVMARHGDAGPYSPENVYCCTHVQNIADADKSSRKPRAPGFIPCPHLRIRGDGHPRSKAIITPLGRFGSAALAADAFRINPATATQRARERQPGWRYEAAMT